MRAVENYCRRHS